MEETMTVESNIEHRVPPEPGVRENLTKQLNRLRDELSRTVHEIRMTSKGAGAEVQDTLSMLEREAKRFSAEVEEAVERTQEDLVQAGKGLQKRLHELANHIAMPPN